MQQALLKLIEGTVANIVPGGGRKVPNHDTIAIDTTNILFICGGAFDGLEKIILQRSSKGGIGFGAQVQSKDDNVKKSEILHDVEPEDLVKFGLIPELIGRLPVVATLTELDEAALIQILTEPKNALVKQYQALFAMEDVELEFSKPALTAIAKKALERKTGARGLRSIMENTLLDTMFDLPDMEDVVQVSFNEQCIENGSPPILTRFEEVDAPQVSNL